MNSLNLAIVKPFAVGQLDDITGILKGNVNITGNNSKSAGCMVILIFRMHQLFQLFPVKDLHFQMMRLL